MADSRIPADVNDAVYRLVKDFGADKLAARTGTPAGTIYNKANPHDTSHHKPTLSDALIWTQITGDTRIVEALCRALGGVYVPLQELANISDAALLDIVSSWMSEQGRFFEAFHQTLADGRVTTLEFDKTDRQAKRVISAILELLGRLDQMVTQ